jgi:hypothetical protein
VFEIRASIFIHSIIYNLSNPTLSLSHTRCCFRFPAQAALAVVAAAVAPATAAQAPATVTCVHWCRRALALLQHECACMITAGLVHSFSNLSLGRYMLFNRLAPRTISKLKVSSLMVTGSFWMFSHYFKLWTSTFPTGTLNILHSLFQHFGLHCFNILDCTVSTFYINII